MTNLHGPTDHEYECWPAGEDRHYAGDTVMASSHQEAATKYIERVARDDAYPYCEEDNNVEVVTALTDDDEEYRWNVRTHTRIWWSAQIINKRPSPGDEKS